MSKKELKNTEPAKDIAGLIKKYRDDKLISEYGIHFRTPINKFMTAFKTEEDLVNYFENTEHGLNTKKRFLKYRR